MRKLEVVSIGLLIVLLFYTLSLNGTVKQLQHQLNNHSNSLSDIRFSLQDVRASINNSLANFERENRWISSTNTVLNNIAPDDKSIEIGLNWTFNNLNKDEIVYLLVGTKKSSSNYHWEKYQVDKKSHLYFEVNITLPLEGDYIFKALAESKEGSRQAELGSLDLFGTLKSRFVAYGHISPHTDKEGIIHITFMEMPLIHMHGLNLEIPEGMTERFMARSVVLDIYLDDTIIETIDMKLEGEGREEVFYDRNHKYKESMLILSRKLTGDGLRRGNLYGVITVKDDMGYTYTVNIQ